MSSNGKKIANKNMRTKTNLAFRDFLLHVRHGEKYTIIRDDFVSLLDQVVVMSISDSSAKDCVIRKNYFYH